MTYQLDKTIEVSVAGLRMFAITNNEARPIMMVSEDQSERILDALRLNEEHAETLALLQLLDLTFQQLGKAVRRRLSKL